MKRVIDSHLHVIKWGDENFITCFDKYRKEKNLEAVNICTIPFGMSNVCNNIMLCFHKIARENTYIHGGIELIEVPIDNMPKEFDAVTQYKELMGIGFDGIKMLEGKPTEHKKIGKNLQHPELTKLYKEMEKDQTHVIMHSNDPDEFWDKDRAPDWAIEKNWAYLDGTYASYEEIQRQTIKILEDFPNIKLTLAHFFFCSKEGEKLEKLFSLYPNLCVDLTPGGEMYVEFEKNYDYYKKFFNKYSDRLIFGTDRCYPGSPEYSDWCYDVVTGFIDTDKPIKSYDDKILMGLGLEKEKSDNILFANFLRRVADKPKTVNKEKFKAYIEKYSFALTDDEKKIIKALEEKYL